MFWFVVSSVLIFAVIYLLSKSKKPRDPAINSDESHLDQGVNKTQKFEMMPYSMFSLGATKEPCTRHSHLRAKVFLSSDPVFQDNPVRLEPGCKCRIERVTDSELERMEVSGIQDSLAPAVLSESGLPTGHRVKKLIPIEKTWEK